LALTIFKDEFESSFVLLFVSLLFLKVFHWLASDRVEMVRADSELKQSW
jgi:E3 ubiquitin-protein ligase synoviolin